MKNFLVIAGTILLINKGFAQNTNLDYPYALKIYNLSSYDEYKETKNDSTPTSYRYTTTTLQILHPTIAFQWKTKKNNFHEIELTNFMLNKVGSKTEIVNDSSGISNKVNEDKTTTTLIALRYEYILNFLKSKDKKLVPSLGFAISPYFKENNYKPTTLTTFPHSDVFAGAKTFVTPRLTYYIKPKFFIDLNIPICLTDTYYHNKKDEDPTVAAADRNTSSFDFSMFPTYFSGRIGIGLKL